MQNWISPLHPHRVFLLDGLGALLSAVLLGVVLVRFAPLFGVEPTLLYKLSLIACLFAVYDSVCYVLRVKCWRVFLRGIALANVFYVLLTMILLAAHWHTRTALGVAYFLGEMAVILFLAFWEWRFAGGKAMEP
jgi:hypothetical protein